MVLLRALKGTTGAGFDWASIELMVEGEWSLRSAVLLELGVSRWLLPDEEGLNAKMDCEYWYCDPAAVFGKLGGFVSIIYNQPKTLQWSV